MGMTKKKTIVVPCIVKAWLKMSGFRNCVPGAASSVRLWRDGPPPPPAEEEEDVGAGDVHDPDLLVIGGRQPLVHAGSGIGAGARGGGGRGHRSSYRTARGAGLV